MFLNMLNERENRNFLELAHQAMMVNGIVQESEEAVIRTYRMEVGLQDYEIQGKNLKDLVTTFQASAKKVKRAVIIELAGVLYADEDVDEHEEQWLVDLGHQWGFRDSEIRKMLRWVQDFNDLLTEGYEYISK